VREGQQPLAGRHLIQQAPLGIGAQLGDQRAGRQCRVHHGLRRQPTPNLDEHQHDFDLATGIGIDAKAQNPDVGQPAPHLAAPAELGVDDLVAGLRS
jgi:hypothetical protein